MILDTANVDIGTLTGTLVFALITIAFGLQKLISNWKSTSTEGSVMSLMHTELERLAKQNVTLSDELGKLHLEIITLNQQLRTLTVENQRLHLEVVSLNTEVNRLQSVLSGYSIRSEFDAAT